MTECTILKLSMPVSLVGSLSHGYSYADFVTNIEINYNSHKLQSHLEHFCIPDISKDYALALLISK